MPATRLTARVAAAVAVVTVVSVGQPPQQQLTADQRLVANLPAAVTAPAPDYDRALFGPWADLDGDGCDARQAVLLRTLEQQVTAPQRPAQCTIVLSGWLTDPYTGTRAAADIAHIDIDHRVALRDAWESGANTWTEEWRTEFANDEDNLVATFPTVNRGKGSRGPDQWKPAGGKSAECAYAAGYAHTKDRWSLGVTDSQRAALLRLLAGC